jgi:hypothetical protein
MLSFLILLGIGYSSPSNVSDKQFELSGAIDDASALEVVQWIEAGGRSLVVNSVGGSESAALQIARSMLNSKAVNVRVDGVCLSACAHYIIPSANRVYVSSTGVIGYHIGSVSLVRYIYNIDEINEYERTLIIKVSKETRTLYSDAGRDIGILLDAARFLQPRCVSFDLRGKALFHTEFDVWVPTYETLARAGIIVSGNLANSGPEAAQRLQPYLDPATRVAFGDPNMLPNEHRAQNEVKKCER